MRIDANKGEFGRKEDKASQNHTKTTQKSCYMMRERFLKLAMLNVILLKLLNEFVLYNYKTCTMHIANMSRAG